MRLNFNTHIAEVSYQYLRRLQIPVNKSTLNKQLQEHPFYPSLFCLSDVLQRFKIDHQAFKLNGAKLDSLKPHFMAYLKNQSTGKDFVLVTSLTGNSVEYIAENNKKKAISREDFLKNWGHIVLKVNESAEWGGGRKRFFKNKGSRKQAKK